MTTPEQPTPSATTWTRLEPQHAAADERLGAAARIADPAWLLARQWQFGEFTGSDGGSPASARMRMHAGTMSGYQGKGIDGDTDRAERYAQQAMPLEVLVEREPAGAVDLSLRADGGRRFARLLAKHGAGAYRQAFVDAYKLPAAVPGAPAHADSAALLAVLAGRLADGQTLAAACTSPAGQAVLPATPAVAAADRPAVLAAVTEYLAWWTSFADRPGLGGQAWVPTRMEHAFGVGARIGPGNDQVNLVAAEYPGGTLDWYDLDVATDGTWVYAPDPGREIVHTGLPTQVRYPGMPAGRFWEFEDARVYLGGVEAGRTDLGRMLLAEFAILYSDDWFVIPVELPVGTVAKVTSLVVTDTFGVSTLIGPSAHGDWDMYRLRAAGADQALFVLPPTLPHSLDGDPVEEVVLLRDEAANVAWAVERLVQSATGRPADRHEQYLAQLRAAGDPAAPVVPSGVDFDYRLRTGQPPEHWIPLIPQADADGLRLRRDALTRPGTGEPIPPLGELLAAAPWIAAQEVPREGARITRAWQLARWSDGSTHLWLSRRKQTGRGEASSGLRHDVLSRANTGS
ncbi:hypothetical protein Cs7R123_09590 [Catellatospora sp. TT07R-123]|uniref:hypothetical protein n=1 Tax=Catellatospora sp. TT07R-123 TaxID=2733863 RepID=UPI001B0C2840|nr:hypothetical protein [Catellatospora sp. TT07R-123]GHJ43617.1 hypothetical protein Cs7R123_09590 [Catellatospora sp. TT07R-123]